MAPKVRNQQTRKNLVIVRAGDASLHPRWLEAATDRSWDLLISYFGDDPARYRDQDATRIDGKGPKWPALRTLIAENPELIARYDYVWLPDDDIACTSADIDRIFAMASRHRLAFCQPALTLESYFSWAITLRNPLTRLRYTNFVEIMVPCFDRDFLLRCLPSMGANLSGFGLDFVWPKLLETTPKRIAILDAVAVTHTRPVGGPNYKLLRERGISAEDEGIRLRQAHGIPDMTIYVRSLITKGGLPLEGTSRLAKLILQTGYRLTIGLAYGFRNPRRWDIDKSLRKQIATPDVFASPYP